MLPQTLASCSGGGGDGSGALGLVTLKLQLVKLMPPLPQWT